MGHFLSSHPFSALLPTPDTVIAISHATVVLCMRGGRRWPVEPQAEPATPPDPPVAPKPTPTHFCCSKEDFFKVVVKDLSVTQEWYPAHVPQSSTLRVVARHIGIEDKVRWDVEIRISHCCICVRRSCRLPATCY